jgi:hypothetical protein
MSEAKPSQVVPDSDLAHLLRERRNGNGQIFSLAIEQTCPASKRTAVRLKLPKASADGC